MSERHVVGYLNPDGTAVITAEGLPPDQAAAACERIDQLARAAKRAGHPGRLDQIRADVFLGLLDGRYHHLTRQQIITQLRRAATQPDADTPHNDDPEGVDTGEQATPGGEGLPVGIEVRVELATLLGHDNHPGEITGWGPVTAEVARRVAARQRRAEWRYAITDHTGHLIRGGITRRRPTDTRDASTGGVVELHIPATLLAKLAANPPPGWAGLINDITRQYTAWPRIRHQLNERAGRWLPTAGLRRHTQIRDRTCRGPGCRRSAARSEFDHTHDYQHGGPTTEANGGNVCNHDHDHDLKTKGGWRLEQPEPGVFIWHSPLGQTHHTRGEPIITPYPEPDDDPDPPPF